MIHLLCPLIIVMHILVSITCLGGSEIDITSELNLIKSQVTECLSLNKQTMEENLHLRNLVKTLVSKNAELEQKVDLMLNGSFNFQNVMPAPRSVSGEFVGFVAGVQETLSNLGDNQDIPFKKVLADTHHAFHGETGVFTCPRAGYYAFFVTILVFPGKMIEYKITKNGNGFGAQGYSKGENDIYGSSTISALIHLQTGDKVWVRVNPDGHTGTGKMIFPNHYSTFKGFSLD